MTLSTLQRQALHILFSFAQADRPTDVRLVARLLMLSQRELRSCLEALAAGGLVSDQLSLTSDGVLAAARLRQRRSVDGHQPLVAHAA